MTGPSSSPTLVFQTAFPPDPSEGAPVAVLLHGRGADAGDLLGLAPALPGGTLIVAPQAPFPGGPWGYGGGWAWYRYVSGDRVVSETLEASLHALDTFLDGLSAHLPVSPGPVVLGGFSQGGTVSLACALRRAAAGRPVPPVMNLSGFLADDATVPLEAASSLRVFWGHGVQDPAIPHALGAKGRERLVESGASVTAVDHPGGHWIDPEEMRAAATWFSEVTRT